MSIEALKEMKNNVMKCVESEMTHLHDVNTKELGEAIDIIKDLSEAIYYCTITESMQKTDKEQMPSQIRTVNYYTSPMYYPNRNSSNNSSSSNNTGSNNSSRNYYTPQNHHEEYSSYGIIPDEDYYRRWEISEKNPKEGKSPVHRRLYMEGKEQHKDIPSQMKELEVYLQELSSDVTEMMKDASQEEKNTLRQKMTNIINKIG